MIDLYTFGTPNGQKASIALEEMGLPYKVHKIDIQKGEQNTPEYMKISPNSKIPAIVDGELRIFESVAILVHLAEKSGKFMPKDPQGRMDTLAWCLFQVSSLGPMMGQFGHFAVFAKEKIPYAIERYQSEVQRLLKVMNTQLGEKKYIASNEYTIADMACWPWIAGYQNFYKQNLDKAALPNLVRWFEEIEKRPAVQRGLKVPA